MIQSKTILKLKIWVIQKRIEGAIKLDRPDYLKRLKKRRKEICEKLGHKKRVTNTSSKWKVSCSRCFETLESYVKEGAKDGN